MKRLLALFLSLIIACQPVLGFDELFFEGEASWEGESFDEEELFFDEAESAEEEKLFDEDVAEEENIFDDGVETSFDDGVEEISIDEFVSSEEVDIFALEETQDILGASIVDSGTCGDNLTWTLDSEGTLTISGTGEMWDFEDLRISLSAGATWSKYHETIKKILIGKNVKSIGKWAFSLCTNLLNVDIPDSVISIGECAFIGCNSLASVSLPCQITTIKYGTFANCDNLSSVSIPGLILSIGDFSFQNCTRLNKITVPNSLTSIGAHAFDNCKSLTAIDIPDSVVNIGDGAFCDCVSLKNIIIPNSVTSIGNNTFYNCESLLSVTIPNSVTRIGTVAFYNCTKLKNLTIPNSVVNISQFAFGWCTSLTSITIPASVSIIGQRAFDNCSNLKKIYFEGDAPLAAYNVFVNDVIATVYYPINNPTWTDEKRQNYSGKITWVPWNPTPTPDITITATPTPTFTPSLTPTVTPTPTIEPQTSNDLFFRLKRDNNSFSHGDYSRIFHHEEYEKRLFQACGSNFFDRLVLYTVLNGHEDGLCHGICYAMALGVTGYLDFTRYLKGAECFYDLDPLVMEDHTKFYDTLTYYHLLQYLSSYKPIMKVFTPNESKKRGVTLAEFLKGFVSYAKESFANHAPILFGIGRRNSPNVPEMGHTLLACRLKEMTNYYIITMYDVNNTQKFYDFYISKDYDNFRLRDSVAEIWNNSIENVWTYLCYYSSDYGNDKYVLDSYNPTYVKGFDISGEHTILLIGTEGSARIRNEKGEELISDSGRFDGNMNVYDIQVRGENPIYYIIETDASSTFDVQIDNDIVGCLINGEGYGLSSETNLYSSISADGISINGSFSNIYLESESYDIVQLTIDSLDECYVIPSRTAPQVKTNGSISSVKVSMHNEGITREQVINSPASEFELVVGDESVQYHENVQKCGDNLTWSISGDTLTIRGTGDMWDFKKNQTPWKDSAYSKVVIQNGVTGIGNRAFYNCANLIDIEIPHTLVSIGVAAFLNCSGLNGIDIPDNVAYIGESAFVNCANIQTIKIPSGVKVIKRFTFEGCRGLSNLTIPASVTSIESLAFSGCWELSEITIPSSVTKIGSLSFNGCSKLQSIIIPFSVTSIDSGAFSYCTSLESILIPVNVTSIEKNVFEGCYKLTIYGTPNSYAESYALENDIPFENVDEMTLNKTVKLAKPSKPKAKNTSKGVKLTWTAVPNAKEYRIIKDFVGPVREIGTTKELSFIDTEVSDGTSPSYYIQCVGYKSENITYKDSKKSKGVKAYFFAVPKSVKVKAANNGKVKVTWKGGLVDSYQIRYADNSSMTGAKTVNVYNTKATKSKTISGLTKKKNYWFQVRESFDVDGKMYYSAWSSKKKIKVK